MKIMKFCEERNVSKFYVVEKEGTNEVSVIIK